MRVSPRPKARVRLPVPVGEFVGRKAELEALLSLTPAQRLITLVGPPGTGKTRLALHAARQLPEGPRVAFVALAQARSADDLPRLTASALDVILPLGADRSAANLALDRALDREPTLLILDNFEQLVSAEGAIPWVADRLASVEGLSLWVTSRERLRVGGERAFEVPPLSTSHDEAVQLLLARAPELAAAEHQEALREIARQLEGIPLALELAAARLVVMGPDELKERLKEHGASRLDLLGRGSRDVTDRQATLRGAIDWSWALLAPEERSLLVALSHLRGSFSSELAAELGAAVLSETPTIALERVQSLREKSLLAPGGPGMLVLLESVRAYGEEKLEEHGARQILAPLVRTLARRARTLVPNLAGRGSRAAFERLEALRDHLVHALALTQERRSDALSAEIDDEEIAEIALALDALRTRLGLEGDLERALRDLLRIERRIGEETTVRLSRALGRVLRDRGQPGEAVMVLERAVARASRSERAGAGELSLLVEIGELLLSQGRFDEAREPIEDAVRGAEIRGERAILQRAQATLGLLAHGQGRLTEAERHYTRALDDAQALGDLRAEAHALRDLGNLCLQRGEATRARAYYQDALEKSPGGDLRLEGVVRGNLAILHQEEGQLEDAHLELKRALACLRAVGDRPFEAHLLGYLGAVHHERGQLDAAREAYGKSLSMLREVRDLRLEGVFSAARPAVLALKGAFGHAQNDLATAQRRFDEVGDPALLVALELHRAAVQLSQALASPGDPKAALAAASQVLARTESAAQGNDDARFAARMLRRLFPAEALVVGPEGSFFELRGERTALTGRPTLARMLDALATARSLRPGEPLSWTELLEAGWPGERVLPQAGQNRVRVALTSLRNLGLRSAIVTSSGGHLLDPALPLTR